MSRGKPIPRVQPGGSRRRETSETLRAVTRAAHIVVALCQSRTPLHLRELSVGLGLNKTTTLRLLRTLVGEGLVTREPAAGRYLISYSMWLRLASFVRPPLSLICSAQGVLYRLAESARATAILALPDAAGCCRLRVSDARGGLALGANARGRTGPERPGPPIRSDGET